MSLERDQDIRDIRACVAEGGSLSRCAGGRLVISGYVCTHCDSDDPDEKCHSPMKPKTRVWDMT